MAASPPAQRLSLPPRRNVLTSPLDASRPTLAQLHTATGPSHSAFGARGALQTSSEGGEEEGGVGVFLSLPGEGTGVSPRSSLGNSTSSFYNSGGGLGGTKMQSLYEQALARERASGGLSQLDAVSSASSSTPSSEAASQFSALQVPIQVDLPRSGGVKKKAGLTFDLDGSFDERPARGGKAGLSLNLSGIEAGVDDPMDGECVWLMGGGGKNHKGRGSGGMPVGAAGPALLRDKRNSVGGGGGGIRTLPSGASPPPLHPSFSSSASASAAAAAAAAAATAATAATAHPLHTDPTLETLYLDAVPVRDESEGDDGGEREDDSFPGDNNNNSSSNLSLDGDGGGGGGGVGLSPPLAPLGINSSSSSVGAGSAINTSFDALSPTPSLGGTQAWRLSAEGTSLRMGGFLALDEGGINTPQVAVKRTSLAGELVMLGRLGSGSSGDVFSALHIPTLQIVAVKQVRMYDAVKRAETVAELKALYGNMLPLVPVRSNAAHLLLPPSSSSSSSSSTSTTPAMEGAPTPFSNVMHIGAGNTLVSPLSFSGSISFEGTLGLTLGGTFGGTLGGTMGFGGTLGGASSMGSTASWSTGTSLASPTGGGEVLVATAPAGNVVRLFDAYVDPRVGAVCMVLEFCGGGTLDALVQVGGTRDEACIARLAAHGLRGLATLHASRSIHRDVKPGNLLLTLGGRALKVGDFGISRQLEGDQLATTWVGTMEYMAPERIDMSTSSSASASTSSPLGRTRGGRDEGQSSGGGGGGGGTGSSKRGKGGGGGVERGYGVKSDIWSLGLSLLAAILGREPFGSRSGGEGGGGGAGGGESYWDLLQAIKEGPPPIASIHEAFAAKSPQGKPPSALLVAFFSRCLAKDPAQRPTADVLLRDPFIVAHARYAGRGAVGGIVEEDLTTCDVGTPLCDAQEPEVRAAFPGDFNILDQGGKDKRLAKLKSVVEAVTNKGYIPSPGVPQPYVDPWVAFTGLFQRFTNKYRRKVFYGLEESACNEDLQGRITSLEARERLVNLDTPGGGGGGGVEWSSLCPQRGLLLRVEGLWGHQEGLVPVGQLGVGGVGMTRA